MEEVYYGRKRTASPAAKKTADPGRPYKAQRLGLVLLVLRLIPRSPADYRSIDKSVPAAVVEDDERENGQRMVIEK